MKKPIHPINEAIGDNLRSFRKTRALPVADIAMQSGLNPDTIYRMERGESQTIPNLEALCKALGVGFVCGIAVPEEWPETVTIDEIVEEYIGEQGESVPEQFKKTLQEYEEIGRKKLQDIPFSPTPEAYDGKKQDPPYHDESGSNAQ